MDFYDAATNTLNEWPDATADEAFGNTNPAYRGLYEALHQPYPLATLKSATPEPFGKLIVALVNAPHVSVIRHAYVDGKPAIGVTTKNPLDSLTLFVQPQTYKPLRLVVRSYDVPGALTLTFTTYKTLPGGSVSMPNLARLHPDARVVGRVPNWSPPSSTVHAPPSQNRPA